MFSDELPDLSKIAIKQPKPAGDETVARTVDDELSKLGWSENARLSFLGDVGRENGWNRNIIFGGHVDPASYTKGRGKIENRGIISWNGDRKTKLDNYLKEQGVLGRRDDDELRAMVRFADKEMQENDEWKDIGKKLRDPSISTYDASENLRRYIKYVPDAPYNTPDPEFRVKNNAEWAKRAKNLGLGALPDLSNIAGGGLPDLSNIAIGGNTPEGVYAGTDLRTGNPIFKTPPIPQIPTNPTNPVNPAPVDDGTVLIPKTPEQLAAEQTQIAPIVSPDPSTPQIETLGGLDDTENVFPAAAEPQSYLIGDYAPAGEAITTPAPQPVQKRTIQPQNAQTTQLIGGQSVDPTAEQLAEAERQFQPDDEFRRAELENTEREKQKFFTENPSVSASTDADVLTKGSAGNIEIDLSQKPAGVNAGRWLLREALKQVAPRYGFTSEEAEKSVRDDLRGDRFYDNLTDEDLPAALESLAAKQGNTKVTVNLTNQNINDVLQARTGGNPNEINPDLRTEIGLEENTLSGGLAKNQNNTRVFRDEDEAKTRTLQELKMQAAKPSFGDFAEFFLAHSGVIGAMSLEADENGLFPIVDAKKRFEEIPQRFGSYKEYQRVREYTRQMPEAERHSRYFMGLVRGVVNQAVSGTLKGLDLVDKYVDYINPIAHLSDKEDGSLRALNYLPTNLRGASNVLGFTIASLLGKGDQFRAATASTDADRRLLFTIGKRIEDLLGSDKYLQDEFGYKVAQGLGSAGGFLLTGMLAPGLSVSSKVGQLSVTSAIAGGLSGAGEGYDQAKQATGDETSGLVGGAFGGLLGASEMFGVGSTLNRVLSREEKKLFLKNFLTFVKENVVREAAEESVQEFFQSAGGKVVLEVLKDRDASAYQRVVNALKRLPKQVASTLVDEVPVAAATGGLFGGIVGGANNLAKRRAKEDISVGVDAVESTDFENELEQIRASGEQIDNAVPRIFHKDFGFVRETSPQGLVPTGNRKIEILEGKFKGETKIVPEAELISPEATEQIQAQGLSFGASAAGYAEGQKVEVKNIGTRVIREVREDGKFLVSDEQGDKISLVRKNQITPFVEPAPPPPLKNAEIKQNKRSAQTKLAAYDLQAEDVVEMPLGGGGGQIQTGKIIVTKTGEILFKNRVLSDEDLSKAKLVERIKKTGSQQSSAAPVNSPGDAAPQIKKIYQSSDAGPSEVEDFTPADVSKNQKVYTEDDQELNITPIVIDDSDLITSFDAGFPEGMQPRDRASRVASDEQIRKYARELNPVRMGDTFDAGRGRPILVPVKVGGKTKYAALTANGRITALRNIFDENGAKAEEFRNFAVSKDENASKFARPVYGGVLNNARSFNLKELAALLNEGTTQMSASEQAVIDADSLDAAALNLLEVDSNGNLNSAANQRFYQNFYSSVVGDTEKGRFMTASGALSQEGIIRMRNAIFAKAFGGTNEGVNALSRLAEDPDNNVKNIANGFLKISGAIAKYKEAAKDNLRFPELDITDSLANALEKYSHLRENKIRAQEYVNQRALPGQPESSPIEKILLLMFEQYKRSPKAIGQILENYYAGADAAGDPNQNTMFGSHVAPKPEELLQAAIQTYDEGTYAAIEKGSELFTRDVQGQQPGDSGNAEKSDPGKSEEIDGNGKTAAEGENAGPAVENGQVDLFSFPEEISDSGSADSTQNSTQNSTDKPTSSTDNNKEISTTKEEKEDEKPTYEFSSTQVNLPAELSDQVRQFARRLIPASELAEDGYEETPHITVKYGLHANNPEDIAEILKDEKPVEVRLGHVAIFDGEKKGKDYDVVYLEVYSYALRDLNEKISENAEVTDTHPVYTPHVTLAYVKKGLGKKYIGDKTFLDKNEHIVFDYIVFSNKNGDQIDIPLTGKSDSTHKENSSTHKSESLPDKSESLPDKDLLANQETQQTSANNEKSDAETDLLSNEKVTNLFGEPENSTDSDNLEELYPGSEAASFIYEYATGRPGYADKGMKDAAIAAKIFVEKLNDVKNLSDADARNLMGDVAVFMRGRLGIKKKAISDRASGFNTYGLPNFKSRLQREIDKLLSDSDQSSEKIDNSSTFDYGGKNKLISQEKAEAARKILREKLKGLQMNTGLDPEIAQAGLELAVFHIEAGARKFADFAKAMIEDLGDGVSPFLKSFYMSAKYYPGLDSSGMDNEADIVQADVEIKQPSNKIDEQNQGENDVTDTNVAQLSNKKDVQEPEQNVQPAGGNALFDLGGLDEEGLFAAGGPKVVEAPAETDNYKAEQIAKLKEQNAETVAAKNNAVFGEEFGSFINQWANAPAGTTPVTTRAVKKLQVHRGDIEQKGQPAKDFIEDVSAALSQIMEAETRGMKFDEFIRQGGLFGGVRLDEAQREIYDTIAANKFDSFFNEVLGKINENTEYKTDVTDSSSNLERDSEGRNENGIRQESLPDESIGSDISLSNDGDSDGGSASISGKENGNGSAEGFGSVVPDGNQSLFESGSAPVRAGSDQLVREQESAGPGSSAGNSISQRIAANSNQGLPFEPISSETSALASAAERQLAEKLSLQTEAENRAVAVGDLENIRLTLPFLLPEQQEDVLIAENRFEKGDGVLFTNGTGTGKTYTGLGIVKRFAKQDKNNIIIVAPNDKILEDWQISAKNLLLDAKRIKDTTDNGGKGIVLATYANFGQNPSLVKRRWDLIIFDESHYLSQNADGDLTNSAQMMRAISLHPDGEYNYANLMLSDDLVPHQKLTDEAADLGDKKRVKTATAAELRRYEVLTKQIKESERNLEEKRKTLRAEFNERRKKEGKSKITFLSATPFAYEKNIEYADGFLFDFGPRVDSSSYNSGDARERFFMTHFGYRMRFNKLTRPDAEVNTELMEQQFNTWLKKQGALSGRRLNIEADYSRTFVLSQSAIGAKIDEGFNWLWESKDETYRDLREFFRKRFDYLHQRFILEAINARESISIVNAHLDLNRKVVVFHDYNKNDSFHPFSAPPGGTVTLNKYHQVNLTDAYEKFKTERPDLVKLDLRGLIAPSELYRGIFGDQVKFFNGTIDKRERRAAVKDFNDDDGETRILMVQADAGREGISLHDTTGKNQRVLINLGLPVRPIAAIQTEGRIYRTNTVSNAIQIYMTTGTSFERYSFGTKISQRSSTAENLALGEEARALKEAFISGYQEAVENYEPQDGEGIGGKESDRAAQRQISEFERAKTYYWGTGKKTSRNKSSEGKDYFATPEPIGLKMVEWANQQMGESALEPSAGHGAIARFFRTDNTKTVIEPSRELASRLSLITDGRIEQDDFESHHAVNKYDTIVMNPPFGVGGKTAVEHLEKAVRHLNNRGRVVALLPEGPLADKRLEKFLYESEAARHIYKVADISLPSATFERAATQVKTHIIVLEKQMFPGDAEKIQEVRRDYSDAATVKELFERIENASVPDRLLESTNPAYQSAVEKTIERSAEDSQFELKEFDHTKTGDRIFVAKLKERVENFKELSAAAKSFGGYYSKYNGGGAIPGFHFSSPEARADFINSFEAENEEMTSIVEDESVKREAFRIVKTLPLASLLPSAEISRSNDRIRGNIQTQEILRRAIEQIDINRNRLQIGDDRTRSSFEGLFADPRTTSEVVKNLRDAAELARSGGYDQKKDFLNVLTDLADEIEEAARIGGRTAIFYVTDAKLPQEIFHQASYLGAIEKSLTRRYANPEKMDSHSAVKQADAKFFSRISAYSVENLSRERNVSNAEARNLRRAIIREETAAWIAEGSWEKLGVDYDTAMDYLLLAIESYADKNGKESLEKFKESSKYVYEAVEIALQRERVSPERSSRKSDGKGRARNSEGKNQSGTSGSAQRENPEQAESEFELTAPPAGKLKLASLPGTERAAGITVNDTTYQVFGDRAAQAEAKKLIEENGIGGAIRILNQIENPDVHHAIASFTIQKQLLNESERIKNSDPEEAKNLRETALRMAANHALAAVKAGRFIRAASIIQQSVATTIAAAQKVFQDKRGRGAILPDKIFERVKALGESAESATAEAEAHGKIIEKLKRDIASLKKQLSGEEKFRKNSKATLAKRRKVVGQIKAVHQAEFEAAMQRLQSRAFLKTKRSARESEAALTSIFDDSSAMMSAVETEKAAALDPEMLSDFAIAGAMKLTEGLASENSMFPSDFDAVMVAEFGEEITQHLKEIHAESYKKRDAWLKEIAKNKKIKEITDQFGDQLSDEEIEEILGERQAEAEKRAAIELLHKIRSKDGNLRNVSRLDEIIAEIAKTKEAAVAASMLASESPTAARFYETMKQLGYEGSAGREILREARDVLAKAQEQLAVEQKDLQGKINEREEEVAEYENLRDGAIKRLKESQKLISKELKRIASGEFAYYRSEAWNLVNSFRALQTAGEVGFMFRQGNWFTIVNLLKGDFQKEALTNMVRALKEKSYEQTVRDLESNPYYQKAVKSGIEFSALGRFDEHSLTKGEEEFRHNIFEKIPIAKQTIGQLIEKSETTMMAFLDTQRMTAFAVVAAQYEAQDLTIDEHPQEFRALARYINNATGRATLGNEKMTNLLMNLPLFAGRFYVSRIKHLGTITVGWAFLPKHTRAVVAKDMLRYYGAVGTVLGLAGLLGLVSLDWEESDFLKIKVGTRRFDILGGQQQWLRFFLQAATSASRKFIGYDLTGGAVRDSVSTEEGGVNEFKHDFLGGKGFAVKFVRTKLAPVPSFIWDYADGKDVIGRKFSWDRALASRMLPIFYQDVYGIIQTEEMSAAGIAKGTVSGIAGAIGIGAHNYEDPPEKAQTNAEKLAVKINGMRMPDKVQNEEDKQTSRMIGELRARQRKGENVMPELTELYKQGKMTRRSVQNFINGADDSYFESKTKRMPTELLRQVRQVANDQEKLLIDDILEYRGITEQKKQIKEAGKGFKPPKLDAYQKQ